MSAANNGGPAFPQPLTSDPGGRIVSSFDCNEDGMSLRDYFAGQALMGLCGNNQIDYSPAEYAKAAQAIANEMLKARAL